MKNKYSKIRAIKKHINYISNNILKLGVYKQIRTGLKQAIEYEKQNKG